MTIIVNECWSFILEIDWICCIFWQSDNADRDDNKKTWIFDPDSTLIHPSHWFQLMIVIDFKSICFQVNYVVLWSAGEKSGAF